MIRRPAVAGQFYHGEKERLIEQVGKLIDPDSARETVTGIVVPHAGFVYSGSVAGAVYSSIKFPDTFVLLGPNHTGLGPSISLMDDCEWEIPVCAFEIDRKLAAKISVNSPQVARDRQAHMFEHSIEVQLPFLSYFSSAVRLVPVCLLSASLYDCLELANGIAKAIRSVDYPVVIAASSDMSHYLPDRMARQKDKMAIEKMLEVDAEGLYETVMREKISMCGVLPVTVMLAAAKILGANSARLIKYATSGEVSGDYDSVVGYAGIVVR